MALTHWGRAIGSGSCGLGMTAANGPARMETLQLRHQLLCPGVCARAGAYDTRRHHVLVFDARNLSLRLLSLRRELKSVPLISDAASDGADAAQASHLEQNRRLHVKQFAQKVNNKVHGGPPSSASPKDGERATPKTVVMLTLAFAATIDAFVCVYAVKATGGNGGRPRETCNVEFIEPATLARLASYPVPPPWRLSCAFFDASSCRLVLAMEQTDRAMDRNDAVHLVDVLQVSRRPMRAREQNDPQSSPEPARRSTMLCIEKMKAQARHHSSLSMITGCKGLSRFFGLVGREQGNGKQESEEHNRVILMWQLEVNDLPQYVVLRRVMLQDRITAMALSPCDNWLFTGTSHGILQVWDVSGRAPSFACGQPSCQTAAAANTCAGIAVIEVSGVTHGQCESVEVVIMTSETDGGPVRHWQFVATTTGDSGDRAAGSSSSLELLGRYAPAKVTASSVKEPKRQKAPSDRAPVTIPICVNVDTGTNIENMVLVLRGDLVHVLKVQAQLVEVCEGTDYDNIVSIRQSAHNANQSFLCLSQSYSSSIRILTAPGDQRKQSFHQRHLAISPSDGSNRITVMETVELSKTQETLIVCGWTNGQVEVYSLSKHERIGLLQDQHLNASITALTVWVDALSTIDGSAGLAPLAGGRHMENKERSSRSAVIMFVAVGIEDGSMFGWEAKDFIASSGSSRLNPSRLMLSATSSVLAAHTTHIIQLQQWMQQSATMICSLGADASVKLWNIPSLTMVAYLNATPSASAAMIPSCLDLVYRRLSPSEPEPFIAVGYDDGALAVWTTRSHKPAFVEIPISGSHERRVTRICGLQTEDRSTSVSLTTRFLSSSFDMTVIMWAILGERVEELKHFDVGAPVVDFCVVGQHVFLAFAHKIYMLSLTGTVGQASNSISQSKQSACQTTAATAPQMDNKQTRDGKNHRLSTPQDSRPPHAQEQLSVSIPSASRRGNPTSQPAQLNRGDEVGTDITSSLNPLVGWASETASEIEASGMDQREAIRAKLMEFIDRTGSKGVVFAESLANFAASLSAVTSLPRKRLRAALLDRVRQPHRRSRDLLDAEEALEVVLYVLSPSTSSADPSIPNPQASANAEKRKSKAVPRRTTVTKPSRRAVISYNSMGEKSIRWVEVEAPESKPQAARVDPDTLRHELSSAGEEIVSPHSRELATPNTGSVSPFTSAADDIEADITEIARSVKFQDEWADTSRSTTRARSQRKKSVAECLGARRSVISFVGEPLVQHLKLSVGFRPFWSPDHCWCYPASPLIVIDSSSIVDGEAERSRRCSSCSKRIHTLELSAAGYRPNFSVRAILEIIGDVYTKLGSTAHAQLFKKAASKDAASSNSEPVTVFGALIAVMKSRYGMQGVVELKVKQFLVSMCHFTRAVDAIAVFGEFLAMHARNDQALDEHVPHELVALCVCCYSWLYSRQMVVSGNSVVGKGSRDSRHDISRACDTSCGRDHWQFVPISCALLCAQDNLMYPLVNPSFLRNILMFMNEYAQDARWLPAIALDGDNEPSSVEEEPHRLSAVSTRWIEVHRFLRLIVGEWRQQNETFRAAERVLFLQCSDWADVDPEIVEKLRLILSCLVFYDHDRVGVMTVADFQNILRRLRYLWPNEHMTEAEAAETTEVSITFENAVRAACARFADRNRDGQLCYLDFWAMLYVVGMRTRSMIKFREIPSFCRDYKLEVAPQLSEVLLTFMDQSCTVLLPQGLLMGKSSFDQKATRQHVRRVAGLHDGTFDLSRTLKVSISATTLIASAKTSGSASRDELFVEPSALFLHQSASVSAVDRFRPVSREIPDNPVRYQDEARNEMRSGLQKKEPALLRVSSLDIEGTRTLLPRELENQLPESTGNWHEQVPKRVSIAQRISQPSSGDSSEGHDHLYIQFHDVPPRRIRPRRPNAIPFAIEESNDGASIDTDERVMDDQLLDLPTIDDVAIIATGVDTEADEFEDRADDEDSDEIENVSPESTPPTSSRHDLEMQEIETHSVHLDSASDRPHLQRRRSNTTIVRVPSVGKEMSSLSSFPSITTAPSPVILARELSPPRTHRSASMTAVAIHRRLEKSQSSDAAGLRSPVPPESLPKSTAREVASDLPADGTDVTGTTNDSESQPFLAAVLANDAPEGGPELVPIAIIDEGENQHGEPRTQSESNIDDDDDKSAAEGDREDQEEANSVPHEFVIDEAKSGIQMSDQDSDAGVTNDDADTVVRKPDGPQVANSVAPSSPIESTPRIDTILADGGMSTSSDAATSPPSIALDVPVDTPTDVEARSEASMLSSTSDSTSGSLLASLAASEQDDLAKEGPATTVLPQTSPKLTKLRLSEPVDSLDPVGLAPDKETEDVVASEMPDRPSTAQSLHSFRFSQQPNFRSGAQAFNNPFRAAQWSPRNDSGSESEDDEGDDKVAKERPFIRDIDGEDGDQDNDNVHDMELRLSETGRRRVRPPPHIKRQLSLSRLSSPGHTGATGNGGNDDGTVGDEEGSYDKPTSQQKLRHRLSNLDERALYGGNNEFNDLGEAISLSPDAEAMIQRKWATLFKEAEVAMFSPLKQALEKKLEEQRLADEAQSQLRKKRQDEAERDALRLRSGAATSLTELSIVSPSGSSPNFRQERARRESCNQLHIELGFGENIRGECRETSDVQYFHFHHNEDDQTGSIITLVLHVIAGDADVYLSTNTLVPSTTDYTWRSMRSSAASRLGAIELSPGSSSPVANGDTRRLVLYPHDLVKAWSLAVPSGSSAEDRKRLSFYVSVIASAPNTLFSISVMCSGQKTEPSRAMQAVDYFIDRFNSFVQSYGGGSTSDRSSSRADQSRLSKLAEFEPRLRPESKQEFMKRIKSVTEHRSRQSVGANESIEAVDEGSVTAVASDVSTVMVEPDVESFQHLLEVLGDKQRSKSGRQQIFKRRSSFMLEGPSDEQRELLQDEEARLQHQVSSHNVGPDAGDTQSLFKNSKTKARHQLGGARARALSQRLSPLKHNQSTSALASNSRAVSLQVAKFAPRPVAYSLSKLEPTSSMTSSSSQPLLAVATRATQRFPPSAQSNGSQL